MISKWTVYLIRFKLHKPDAQCQWHIVHFSCNIFTATPIPKLKMVDKRLKAIDAQGRKKVSRERARAVIEKIRSMEVKEATKKLEEGAEEMLIYCDFSNEHGSHVRHSNVIERMSREIYRRIRAVEKLSNGYASIAG